VVEVVTIGYLRRAAVAASIMRDHPITFTEEEQHLRVPIVPAQRLTMTEHNGLPFAPVFVIDVNVTTVFFAYSYVWHGIVTPFLE
jgi:hypothetical protein